MLSIHSIQELPALLAQMTLREKIGQLNQCGNSIYNQDYQIGWSLLREGRIGSFLGVFEKEKIAELQHIAVEETRLGIPLLFGYDVIHGFSTTFPVPWAEACAWEPELAYKTARLSTMEAASQGINWLYAPMVDVANDARWGRIVEGSGEDPYLASRLAAARVQGIQGADMADGRHAAACAKHFAAYGACSGGRDYNSVDMSAARLADFYLPPFEAAVHSGAASIMTGFHDLNGEPCTGSHFLLTELLRNRMGFEGVTISDAGATAQIMTHGYADSLSGAAKAALLAGTDVEMCFDVFTYQDHLEQLVESREVPMEAVDAAVLRVLTLKYKLGLFADPFRWQKNIPAPEPELRSAALESAEKSVILLKNSGCLPLKSGCPLICTGSMGNSREEMLGAWSAIGRAEDCVSPWDALRECPGVRWMSCEEALRLAENQTVAVFFGESRNENGEGKSRTRNTLPEDQLRLLQALKAHGCTVISVIIAGRPLVLTQAAELSDAVLFSGALGCEAGNAYRNILFGAVNPSAKTVNTFPTTVGQTPLYYNHHNTGKPPVEEWFWTSKYCDCPIEPLFPFGFGLSYSSYRYSQLTVTPAQADIHTVLQVQVCVANTGSCAGEEIVQLYIRDPVASLVQPVKVLKRFRKVALRPGEEKTVTFALPVQELGFHKNDLSYVVEPGVFTVMVGGNSRDTLAYDIRLL